MRESLFARLIACLSSDRYGAKCLPFPASVTNQRFYALVYGRVRGENTGKRLRILDHHLLNIVRRIDRRMPGNFF